MTEATLKACVNLYITYFPLCLSNSGRTHLALVPLTLYRSANDPGPQMIPVPLMIPKLDRK